MTYDDARREARKLFGPSGEVKLMASFTCTVGVVLAGRYVIVGVGPRWEDALADAKKRQQQ